jgi:hypothetical protein
MEDIMALTLGVKVGDVVDVAEHWVAVLSIDTRDSATLISNEGRKIEVSARGMTEMVPEVWIGLGPDATRRTHPIVSTVRCPIHGGDNIGLRDRLIKRRVRSTKASLSARQLSRSSPTPKCPVTSAIAINATYSAMRRCISADANCWPFASNS